MKDAYSFHMAVEGPGGLNEAYDAMYRAYTNIFTRCQLDFSAVEAESGPIGGSASHEFMVNCASGEDTVLKCPVSGYAANVEKCEIGERATPSKGYFAGEPSGTLEEVHTPDCPGIEDVCKVMKVKPQNMLKSVLFKVNSTPEQKAKFGEEYILAVVRGDHDVNEGKVKAISGCTDISLADPAEAIKLGFAIGFVSPRAAVGRKGVLLLVDRDAAISFDDAAGKSKFWVTGGDKKDYHVKHFNWQRDLGKDPLAAGLHGKAGAGAGGELNGSDQYMVVGDVRNALEGDPSPRGDAKLVAARGIEVGHIFKLATKYSDAMGFSIQDKDQQKKPVIMGCYGIGVSRTMAACVEMSHDAEGIVWPSAIAPYHVQIVLMKHDDPKHLEVCAKIAGDLAAAGIDVLIDDRDERPGVKFKDADLVGIPIRLTIGDKALEQGSVEFKKRKDAGKGELVGIEGIMPACRAALGG
jgi:prolyl-tRNA synthetase